MKVGGKDYRSVWIEAKAERTQWGCHDNGKSARIVAELDGDAIFAIDQTQIGRAHV